MSVSEAFVAFKGESIHYKISKKDILNSNSFYPLLQCLQDIGAPVDGFFALYPNTRDFNWTREDGYKYIHFVTTRKESK